MRDSLLLAQAALAYFDDAPRHLGEGVLDWVRDTQGPWNPRDNSSDSFDLLVKLSLNVYTVRGTACAMESDGDGADEQKVEQGKDPRAAMRLAILLVAAAMGRALEESLN